MARVKFQGEIKEGEEVGFKPDGEEYVTYTLDDGSTLKMRIIVKKVVRLEETNEVGEPIYVVQSANIIDADVPDHLIGD